MDKVVFTHLEDNGDIIFSLSFSKGTEFGVDGFTIQRNRKLEALLGPHERGACIEWGDSVDIRVLLDEVHITRTVLKIRTKRKVREYCFDIGGLPDDEYDDLRKHFQLINFDGSIKIKTG
jgi:hypothetical protein